MPKTFLLAAMAATLVALPAYAQNPDAPLKGRDSDPAVPSGTQTPPDRVRPSANAPPKDQSLSDKLQKNDGVIKPFNPSCARIGCEFVLKVEFG